MPNRPKVTAKFIVPVVIFEIGWGLKRGRIEGPADVHGWRNRVLSLGVREIGLSAEIARDLTQHGPCLPLVLQMVARVVGGFRGGGFRGLRGLDLRHPMPRDFVACIFGQLPERVLLSATYQSSRPRFEVL